MTHRRAVFFLLPRRTGWAHATIVTCAAIALLSGLIGCDKKQAKPAQPTTEAVGSSTAHLEATIKARPVVFAPVPPAPKPGALASDASCVTAECHADYTRAPQIHGPIAERACKTCHADDAGGHKYPLKRSGDATCTFCHSVSGTQAHQHKALDQGCTACHSPHVSTAKFLLKKDNVEQLCLGCHNLPLKGYAHEPFIKGQCTLCHQAHQSENAKLLRGGEGAAHCYTCHGQLQSAMKASTFVHKPAAENCDTCHDAHTTDFPHQLRKPVDQTCLSCHKEIQKVIDQSSVKHAAMTIEKQCANCHNPHASDNRDLMIARMDQTCLTCHDKPLKAADGHTIKNMKPVLTQSEFLHGPIRAGSCSGCHDPHGAKHDSLLDRAFPKSFYAPFDLKQYDLCFGCHESKMVLTKQTTNLTNFRDGPTNLHYAHVNNDEKGRTCKTCHALHGSDLPNHIATEVPFEGSNWTMPIGYEKTIDGGTCSPGCHKPRSYNRRSPATRPVIFSPGAKALPVTKLTTQPTTRGTP